MSEIKGQVHEKEDHDPEREARRRAAFAQIRQYGDPVLRLTANEVEIFDDDLQRLVERMARLMRDANGVGLAANQIGVLRRVLVVQLNEEGAMALVNPQLVERSDETRVDDEGCLSLQGVSCPVERASEVTVEAFDPNGNEFRLELEELAARVIQHEVDHLDGVLMIDRTTAEARREALGLLRPRLVLGA